MGYSWIDPVGIVFEVIDEIHENLDSLYSDLELKPHSWSYDADEGIKIDDTHMTEIEEAVEYADEMNYCRTHNADHRITDLSAYDNNEDISEDVGILSGHDSVITAECPSYCGTHYSSREYTQNASEESSYQGNDYGELNSSHDDGHYGTYLDAENSGVHKDANSLVQNDYETTAYASKNSIVDTGFYSNQDSGLYSGADSSALSGHWSSALNQQHSDNRHFNYEYVTHYDEDGNYLSTCTMDQA